MKIAVIGAKGLPPKQGGIEHYCAEMYPRMVSLGHSVDLYARSSYTNGNWFEKYDYDGVKVISVPSFPKGGVDAFFSSGLSAIASGQTSYDIIHFHALGPALFTAISRLRRRSKIVVTCQGLDWQRAKWGNFSSRIIRTGEEAAVKFADEIIVVSKALQNYFAQTYGRETVYIPNAPASYVQSDPKFTFGQNLGLQSKHYILFLGRLVPEKRPELLIKAFLKAKPPGWKLVLAGGISDTHSYGAELMELVSNHREVVFAGELHGARLAEIVRGAGLFALPSDLEGLPLAMLEAMREGIPVLASDILPHQQLLMNNCGIMFAAGDVDACAQKINWAIANPAQLQEMAANAQRYIKLNYTWERITADNLQVYNHLIGETTFVSNRTSVAKSNV